MRHIFAELTALTFLLASFSAFGDNSSAGENGQTQPIPIMPHACIKYYPAAAVKAHAQGTATVSFQIKVDGTVGSVKIEKSAGNKDLDDASVTCVSLWHYRPATQNSSPIEVPWKANVDWRLSETESERVGGQCLYLESHILQKDAISIPTDIGITRLTFRIMPDGRVTDVNVASSSGDTKLDEIGRHCAADVHFDTSMFTVRDDGLPGHLELDWAHIPPPSVPQ